MSGARVSIPNNVRKTIQNIKEITGNHSEDEIYAMLKECSMDPNETTQKLLLQDPFHEVKRKRDRKKENLNKEITEPKLKPGMQGKGNRGGRGNYPSRHISNDAVGGRTSFSAKENGINQGQKNKETFVIASPSSSKLSGPLPQIPTEANKGPTIILGSNATSASKTASPSPGVGLSDSDPILMPSTDSRLLGGTIGREVGSQRTTVDQIHETPVEGKLNSSGKVPVEVQGMSKNLLLESPRVGPSSHVSNSRPSSNYNNRPQQAIGPQKVGTNMEWKPKPTNPILTQDSVSIESTKVPVIPVESQSQTPTLSASTNLDSNILIKKLEDSHISDNQHVIIPNHLHVPEAEKLGFCFGSFDASFGLNMGSLNGPGPEPVSDKSSIASEVVDESIEDQQLRNQDALSTGDQGDDPDRPTFSSNKPENLPVENDDSSNAGHHHQYPAVHTSPNFSFGFMPPMIGTHLNESQYPLVQQPIDPASYYAQFYRSSADADGRVSPFHSTGVPNKFNGNIPILPPQTSQPSQEVGNSIMSSGTNPTPTTTAQTGEIMHTSIPVTQQPLPVFRQPTGVHLPHYPPNYIPYGPYFSPFYVPQPTIHQFLSNGGTFSQHPQTGNMYPGPPVANPNPKYPVPQYNPGGNAGHFGMQGNYGPYGSNPAGFSNPGSVTTTPNLGSNEDHGGSQFKENNVYITGQQSEGSGVWVGPPGRDISGLQPNSFYNMGQAGHGPFANIYHHPTQPVTTGAVHPLLQHPQTLGAPGADMAGPTPQINWPNNY